MYGLLLDTTYKLLLLSIAILVGPEKVAFVPVPSALPATFTLPANVTTLPVGLTLRIRLFCQSQTKRLPALSSTMPAG